MCAVQNPVRHGAAAKPRQGPGRAKMEAFMTRSVIILAVASAAFAPAVQAQPAPDTENGRYTFSAVADGMLRLDTRTGAVSICAKRDASWACTAVPDERQALESEIARLQRENG